MQMAAYRTDLSHSYSYVTWGSVHVSFLPQLLLLLLLLVPPSISLSFSFSCWLSPETHKSVCTCVAERAHSKLSLAPG